MFKNLLGNSDVIPPCFPPPLLSSPLPPWGWEFHTTPGSQRILSIEDPLRPEDSWFTFMKHWPPWLCGDKNSKNSKVQDLGRNKQNYQSSLRSTAEIYLSFCSLWFVTVSSPLLHHHHHLYHHLHHHHHHHHYHHHRHYHRLNVCVLSGLYIKILTPNVLVLEGGALGR